MGVSLVCLRNSTKNLKAKNVIFILHSSFFILHSSFFIFPRGGLTSRSKAYCQTKVQISDSLHSSGQARIDYLEKERRGQANIEIMLKS